VKITVIANGFKEVHRQRDRSEPAAALNNARAAVASVQGTYEVAGLREPKPTTLPQASRMPDPPVSERPRAIPYIPEDLDDIDSEIVRHAEPLDETVARHQAAPEPVETVSSSVDIRYDADDLEIPAFLRKRAES
jgi:hypothetical protein